ncbi:hypothetical protein [Alicyclobacillus sp. SO9]|uniref:hypothetical protein n=1 Tax=Alicyclobacillus sp. SO9 TaxID=2665646 RepID=UPI0018E80A35|nr:hypothetical protein [Alicyclobacillus sp. SO9]
MTTRFSLSELSEMLGVPVDVVRTAVEHLAGQKELTAETFVYGQRSWRVAPSDVKRLQDWIQSDAGGENLRVKRPQRRIKRKQKVEDK